ncbi:hypothetical protein BO94DRAFT_551569 [Aspergillus sclerotioniger CBS 115572]|uniref:Amino acid transporter transmembrane domain-containing protein n=1 Tax=Aspergillus sclerotioniger CBS 115572 TaxID=1450535 RepID=A0A317UX68_9EURO|nr:hypothetical protein BO94DRAFT_551569 [Aspergillus sclerotioniger CBS 115572]PWY66146.1 hypothetical protein BO94DRAFT_551569 [Aspergillus sclerotioniger CBS 115572]
MVGAFLDKTGHRHSLASSMFRDAFVAVATVVFAYAGHVAFFTLFPEFRDVKAYPKALVLLQLSKIMLYRATAIVIYKLFGPDVTISLLSWAIVQDDLAWECNSNSERTVITLLSQLVKHTSKSVIAGVVNTHVAAKRHALTFIQGNVPICAINWLGAWILVESIPVFNDVSGFASPRLSLPGIILTGHVLPITGQAKKRNDEQINSKACVVCYDLLFFLTLLMI